jgi:hypothetical protein
MSASAAPEPPRGVIWHAGKLSVHVEGTSLRQVLAEVSALSHTPMVWLNGEGQEEAVSLKFTDLPLREGVERLLQRHNFVLFYEPHPTGMQLKRVWIASTRKATQPPAPQEATEPPRASTTEEAAGQREEFAPTPERGRVQSVMQTAAADSALPTRPHAVRSRGTRWQNDAQARATLGQSARRAANVRAQQAVSEVLQGHE